MNIRRRRARLHPELAAKAENGGMGEPDWLAGADERFVAAVDAAVAAGEARCGGRLDYTRACPACCLGPFPINRLDVLRLRRGLAELAAREPARAEAIVQAARDAVREQGAHFPATPPAAAWWTW